MALYLMKQMAVLGQRLSVRNTLKKRLYSLYDPDYLEVGKSKFPLFPTLNIKVKGYDYPVLECYQSFLHKLADIMQLDVDDSWPLPCQELKIQKYKTGTSKIESEYNLNIYERHMQISEISSVKCSILIRALEAALPSGVTLNIDTFDPALEQKRYVPDKQLIDLKSELTTFTRK